MTAELESDDARFIRRALVVIALAAAALLLWQLRFVVVLLFGAVLIATIFRAIADLLEKYLRLPNRLAVLVSVLLVVGVIGAVVWAIGAQVAAQGQNLADTLPRAAQIVDARLAAMGLGNPVSQSLQSVHSGGALIGSNFKAFVSSVSLSVASVLIVFFGGIFLAAQPRLYGIGTIKLIPPGRRRLVAEAMDESDRALRLWLKGQLWAMILIFLMTWGGLSALGVPSALVLALISGVLEFIPYAGAITSSIPAIMVALVQSPQLALWVAALYIIVHHVEAYLIQPVIQQFAVEIPAVITLFALLAFGLLFGILGILLAAPLAVVCYVLVKRLYVIEALDTPTPIPGEDKR
ncbi:MAG TPA: AI-2E family transporter [Sphingomicrobium sp.]|nr:AI-2E family transporter [Sphingomicrobium sp.]